MAAVTTPLVCLDAGHGPAKAGAVHNGLDEQSLNWAMVQTILRIMGDTHSVVLTRPSYWDTPELIDRAKIANAAGALIFVSVHFNAFTRPSASGPEVYHHPNSVTGRHMAGAMSDRIAQETGRVCRVKNDDFAVLRYTKMPGLLIEGSYLTNPDDAEDLRHSVYPDKLALGIVRGIAECLKIVNAIPTLRRVP